MFRYNAPAGLTRVGIESRGINHPTSIALHGNVLYVLNAQRINCDPGTGANITGFRVSDDGSLTPIPGSTQSLSGLTNAVRERAGRVQPEGGCADRD